MKKYEVGETIQPFPGGGQYGRCFKCRRTGLTVIEIPPPVIIKPKGWTKIPKE